MKANQFLVLFSLPPKASQKSLCCTVSRERPHSDSVECCIIRGGVGEGQKFLFQICVLINNSRGGGDGGGGGGLKAPLRTEQTH